MDDYTKTRKPRKHSMAPREIATIVIGIVIVAGAAYMLGSTSLRAGAPPRAMLGLPEIHCNCQPCPGTNNAEVVAPTADVGTRAAAASGVASAPGTAGARSKQADVDVASNVPQLAKVLGNGVELKLRKTTTDPPFWIATFPKEPDELFSTEIISKVGIQMPNARRCLITDIVGGLPLPERNKIPSR